MKEQMWQELLTLYPSSSNGRPLKNHSKKLKDKYFKRLEESNMEHSIVMEALKKEKSLREKAKQESRFYPDWPMLSTWINQERWNAVIEVNFSDNKRVDGGTYGTNLL